MISKFKISSIVGRLLGILQRHIYTIFLSKCEHLVGRDGYFLVQIEIPSKLKSLL